MSESKIKLNLGCGNHYLNDYVNVDLYPEFCQKVDASYDIKNLPHADETVDEIISSHVIEHFDMNTGQKVLKEWYRALKPQGILRLETPDLYNTCKEFVNGDYNKQIFLYANFFSCADIVPGQAHLFLYTERQLAGLLNAIGFSSIKRITPWSLYANNPSEHHLYLAIEAIK